MRCLYCGAEIAKDTEICPQCGHSFKNDKFDPDNFDTEANTKEYDINEDTRIWQVAMLLCWFVGIWGVHRFYTKRYSKGWLTILSFIIFIPLCAFLTFVNPLFGIISAGLYCWLFLYWIVDIVQLLRNKYTMEDGEPLIYFSKIMRNIFLGGIILFVLFVGLNFVWAMSAPDSYFKVMQNFSGKQTQNITRQKTVKKENRAYNKNSKFAISPLSNNAIQYVSKKYSNSWVNKNKKIVVYIECDNCIYKKRLAESVKKYAQNAAYKKYYNFEVIDGNKTTYNFNTREEAVQLKAFFDECRAFCIINPKTNEIVSYKKTSDAQENLYKTFNTFKEW